MQSSVFSDVSALVESGFNHFRSVIRVPHARVAATSEVDKKVDAAWQHLRSLFTRRNALAPISLLPPEILTRIFHFLVLDEPPRSRNPNLGWIKATHVCRLWRQVALADSSLWARISGSPTITLISVMLARARDAHLDINLDLCGNPSPDILLMFTLYLSRTRELRLHNLSEVHSDSVRGICSQEAPALEHLELDASATSLVALQEIGGTTLFKGRAPKLQTIILSQFLIPWSLIPRGQLTQLTVGLSNEAPIASVPSRRNLNQLIDLLVNSPGLEVLVLESCLPSQLSQSPYGQTIHLPRLSRLYLGGSSSRITNLLRMLRLPSSTMLHLHCISENTPTHNDHFLLPVISAHLQSHDTIEFKYLSVTLNYKERSLDVAASTSLPTFGFRDFTSHVDHNAFLLSFDGLPELGDWTDLVERVFKMLPISNLEFFSISAPDVVDPLNLVELFKGCAKVTMLQAIGRGTSGLVKALATSESPKVPNTTRWDWKKTGLDNGDSTAPQLAESMAKHAHAPIFPKLTFLSLRRLGFAEIYRPTGIVFDVVERGLRQRKVVDKAPLKMLCIDDCAVSTKRARALQKLVLKFHWDKDERLLDEIDEFDYYDLGLDDYDSDYDEYDMDYDENDSDYEEYDSDYDEPGTQWPGKDHFVGTTHSWWGRCENYADEW